MLAVRNDSVLVHAARRGDDLAFTRLYERHLPAVLAAAKRVLGDFHLAQDVAQEAFLRARRGLRGLDDESVFGNWVCRIARNIAVDRLRAQRTHPEDRLLEPDQLAESAGAAAQVCEAPRVRDDAPAPAELWRALATLPDRDRRFLLLRYGRGLSCADVARECGVSVEVVKVALHRGRAKLAHLLAER